MWQFAVYIYNTLKKARKKQVNAFKNLFLIITCAKHGHISTINGVTMVTLFVPRNHDTKVLRHLVISSA